MQVGANPPVAGRLTSVYTRFEFGPEVFWEATCSELTAVLLQLYCLYHFCLQCLKCFFLQRKMPVWGCEVESSVLQHCLPDSPGWKNRGKIPCQWNPTRNNCGPALCLFISRNPKQVTGGTRGITAMMLQSVHAHVVACPSWLFSWTQVATLSPLLCNMVCSTVALRCSRTVCSLGLEHIPCWVLGIVRI